MLHIARAIREADDLQVHRMRSRTRPLTYSPHLRIAVVKELNQLQYHDLGQPRSLPHTPQSEERCCHHLPPPVRKACYF